MEPGAAQAASVVLRSVPVRSRSKRRAPAQRNVHVRAARESAGVTNELTHSRLLEKLVYERTTGVFRWRSNTRGAKAGVIAGAIGSNGYRKITIDTKQYRAHRLAWFYVHGSWPEAIDHRDHNKDNNSIKNLRDASRNINSQNLISAQRRNKTGLLGVAPHRKKWAAKLVANGKKVWLGVFDTPELAHAAYVGAKRVHHEGNTL